MKIYINPPEPQQEVQPAAPTYELEARDAANPRYNNPEYLAYMSAQEEMKKWREEMKIATGDAWGEAYDQVRAWEREAGKLEILWRKKHDRAT